MSKVNAMLEKLSGGEKSSTDLLSERKAEYLESYGKIEESVKQRQIEADTQLPFVQALKSKVAKLVNTVDSTIPVVTRYDIYTGIRKISERSNGDQGLKKLSSNLERVWQADPLGTLSHAEVDGLVKLYKDTYPRSKAADAIEAECSRVGLHKLPVSKLAKIASQINSQEDYESLMEANGFAGNRVEQIRARSLVRGLVAMRGNTIESADTAPTKDGRSTDERVADRIAQLDMPPAEPEMAPELPGAEPEMPIEDPMAMEPMGVEPQPEQLGQAEDLIQQVEEGVQEVLDSGEYVDLQPYFDHEMTEGHSAPVGTAAWGAEEILNEGHEAVPGTPEWVMEEEQELAGSAPEGDMGMGGLDMPPAPEPGLEEPPMMMASKEAKSRGKGIPMPAEKPKAQPKVTTYAPKPASGGAAIKATVEENLLDGKTVKAGSVSIKIGNNDTVELWTKEGGRECDLVNIDVAITDFIKLAADEKRQDDIFKTLTFVADRIVEVPCEHCANVTMFKAAKRLDDTYPCDCGFKISAQSTLEAHKALGKLPSFDIDMRYKVASKEQFELKRDLLHKSVLAAAGENPVGVVEDDVGVFHFVIDDVDSKFITALTAELSKNFDAKRVAELPREKEKRSPGSTPTNPATGAPAVKGQNLPPARAPRTKGLPEASPINRNTGAPKAPVQLPGQAPLKRGPLPTKGAQVTQDMGAMKADDTIPMSKLVESALTNYKAQGMNIVDAMNTFRKEHADRLPELDKEGDALLLAVANTLWSSDAMSPGAADMMAPEPSMGLDMPEPSLDAVPEPAVDSMDTLSGGAGMPAMASVKTAEGGMKVPSVRKPKDKVKVDKDLGKDTSQDEMPNLPKKFKPSTNKPHGKMSPKDLGKDSEGKDILPNPGKPSATHSPTSQPGTSLPTPDLGSDSEPNDAFSVPGQGAKPSVKHKQ